MSESLHLNGIEFICTNYADEFLILKCEQATSLLGIGTSILDQQLDFIDEVICTETEICIRLNENFSTDSLSRIQDVPINPTESGREIILPVFFSEEDDWPQVIKHTGLSRKEYIQRLLSKTFTIAMFGFLPGFVYLNGLTEDLYVPRKKNPSKSVRSKALAIGENYLGIYSLNSPGGWNVIGDLAAPVLDLNKLPPIRLGPFDKIQLKSISKETFQNFRH